MRLRSSSRVLAGVELNMTMTKMSSASMCWPRKAEITLATRRIMTKGFRNRRNNSNAKAPRRVKVGSLAPNLERRASVSCAVRPANVAEGLDASRAEAEGTELIELPSVSRSLIQAQKQICNCSSNPCHRNFGARPRSVAVIVCGRNNFRR
jgi:hypothetical protein